MSHLTNATTDFARFRLPSVAAHAYRSSIVPAEQYRPAPTYGPLWQRQQTFDASRSLRSLERSQAIDGRLATLTASGAQWATLVRWELREPERSCALICALSERPDNARSPPLRPRTHSGHLSERRAGAARRQELDQPDRPSADLPPARLHARDPAKAKDGCAR